jgi:hypothetical protein
VYAASCLVASFLRPKHERFVVATVPTNSETELQALRLRYNAAYTAYRGCVHALNEASMSGELPSPALLENEARALRELTEARGKLLAAMRTL